MPRVFTRPDTTQSGEQRRPPPRADTIPRTPGAAATLIGLTKQSAQAQHVRGGAVMMAPHGTARLDLLPMPDNLDLAANVNVPDGGLPSGP
jgi:hypothetical protein